MKVHQFSMKALFHTNKSTSEIKILNDRPLLSGQIKVRSLYSMVSLGTEKLVASGRVPNSLWDYMDVPYQEGGFDFPIKYGYSLVGEVIEGSDKLKGKRIHCLHPHQNEIIIAEEDAFLIPDYIPSGRASLASNLETAVTGLWDAEIKINDKVLIVGFGMIGALVAGCLKQRAGQRFEILEVNEERKKKAEDLNLAVADESSDGYDVVFHCSATEGGLQAAIDKCAFEGKVVELSWYGDRKVNIDLGSNFHYGRKRIISSQVSHIPSSVGPDMTYRKRKEIVFDILKDSWFEGLLDNEIAFDELPGFFGRLRQGEVRELSGLVKY